MRTTAKYMRVEPTGNGRWIYVFPTLGDQNDLPHTYVTPYDATRLV